MTNIEWLSQFLNIQVQTSQFDDLSDAGGYSGSMRRLVVNRGLPDEKSFVLKKTKPGTEGFSATLGLAREGYFYARLAKDFPEGFLPKVHKVYANMLTGEKTMLMEDLRGAIQTGYFFGPYSPHNWGKDLAALTAPAPGVTFKTILEEVCQLAGKMHARFWMKKDLLDSTWLRGVDWIVGKGKEGWLEGQMKAKESWCQRNKEGAGGVRWSKEMAELLEASFNKISWEDFQVRLQGDPWTFVHGDYHPANMMWKTTLKEDSEHNLVLLDWEGIGVGCGAQDLGQYFISHLSPKDRREVEEEAVKSYYDSLIKSGVDGASYSFDKCRWDVVHGGVERWVWLIGIMTNMGIPDQPMQYFHDQLEAFVLDHHITPTNVGMPRL
uniref:CHK kinase-like domain-containing protein n=1 Tax=Arcella intermedia TaxID=1963864 RepID=A0A6B2L6U5_9EUKA